MAEIELHEITKNFGRTQVLKGVSLKIEEGEFIALLGPSGCGKSTLLRIIAGLDVQDSGALTIGGRDVGALSASDRNLAMVFQSYALYPHLSVADNMMVPLRMRDLSAFERLPLVGRLSPGLRAKQAKMAQKLADTAKLLHIEPLLARKPGQLSGGQRQRVALGRAMVRDPSAFLMDEPLSNLDAALRVHMRSEIAQLHRALGTTFVYVTHDQVEAMTMATRIAVMLDGCIMQLGTPAQIYEEPRRLEVAQFIGSPKINLLEAVVDAQGMPAFEGAVIGPRFGVAPGTRLRLGIRAEHLRLANPDKALLAGRLSHKENLGAEMLLHLALAGSHAALVVRAEPQIARPLALGQTLGVEFDARDLKVFDEAGARILPLPELLRRAAHV